MGREGLVRALVLPRRLTVPGADAEHEAAGIAVVHPGERAGYVVRAVLPHVHDAGAEDEGARRVEQLLHLSQATVGRATQPEHAVAAPLDVGSQLGRRLVGAAPDPVSS